MQLLSLMKVSNGPSQPAGTASRRRPSGRDYVTSPAIRDGGEKKTQRKQREQRKRRKKRQRDNNDNNGRNDNDLSTDYADYADFFGNGNGK